VALLLICFLPSIGARCIISHDAPACACCLLLILIGFRFGFWMVADELRDQAMCF
jgi:hypothetical protein